MTGWRKANFGRNKSLARLLITLGSAYFSGTVRNDRREVVSRSVRFRRLRYTRRIGAGLKNKRKQAQLDAAARRIAKKHGAEIQASLNRFRKARAKRGTSRTSNSEEMGNKQRPDESPK